MYETNIVIVGNALTAPEWRRTSATGTLVANFRVASTARRLDRETGRWVDGDSLRVRVTCWRRLAEGVTSSIAVGDPVVVTGRLYTRDWTDADGNNRTSFEMEAVAVGHDLSRGRARFQRNRPAPGVSTTDGTDAEGYVRGEPAEPVDDGRAPVRYGDGLPPADEPGYADAPAPGWDPVAVVRGGHHDLDADASPGGTNGVPAAPAGRSPGTAAQRAVRREADAAAGNARPEPAPQAGGTVPEGLPEGEEPANGAAAGTAAGDPAGVARVASRPRRPRTVPVPA